MSNYDDDGEGFSLRPSAMSNTQLAREQAAGDAIFTVGAVGFGLAFGWLLGWVLGAVYYVVTVGGTLTNKGGTKAWAWWSDEPRLLTEEVTFSGLVGAVALILIGMRLGNTLALNLWLTVVPAVLSFVCGIELGRHWRFYFFIPRWQRSAPGGRRVASPPRRNI